MFLFVATILFGGFLFALKNLLFGSWRHKNKEVKAEEPPKFIFKGQGSYIKVGFLSLPFIRKYFRPNDSVYDIFISEYGTKKIKPTVVTRFLNTTIVIPQDAQVSRSILGNPELCSGKVLPGMQELYYNGRPKGININDGEEVKELRRFTVKTLAQLGFGKTQVMPNLINEQLSELREDLDALIKSTGNKVPVTETFARAAINILWGYVSGQKFLRGGKALPELFFHFKEIAQLDLVQFGLIEYFPLWFLLSMDRFGTGYNKFTTNMKWANLYFKDIIEEMKLKLDRNADPENFIDAFLLEAEKHKDNPDLKEVYNTEQLTCVVFDIFLAGIDTTSKFMEVGCTLMALNPDIQIKVQEEIDSVMGDKVPSYWDHRAQMPFTQAAVWEIHRFANIITQTARLPANDFTLDGHNFKKGTLIVHAFFYYRMDECFWGDPKVFRPQRFLDSENNIIMDKVNHVMPYSFGSRGCMGDHVAAATTFSFLTGILQKYNVKPHDPKKEMVFNKGYKFVSHLAPYYLSLSPRF